MVLTLFKFNMFKFSIFAEKIKNEYFLLYLGVQMAVNMLNWREDYEGVLEKMYPL